MKQLLFQRQRGQSLVVVALLMITLFLIIGLAIDGGVLYMQRRLMQNTADAACLAAANQVALSQTDSAAITRAQQVIAQNLGPSGAGTGVNAPGTLAYASIADVYSSDGTTGVSLTRGIEISGNDVRVAISSPATTFFMRVAGLNQYSVGARSHCGASAAGGAMPFAVVRFRGYEGASLTDPLVSGAPNTDLPLPQTYRRGSNNVQMTVRDVLRRESASAITQWPGWGSADYPGDPVAGTGLYSTPGASEIATTANPGPEVTLAGTEANSNVPSNTSFTGPIVLDFRNTTFPQPLFYNGLTPDTALNQYKDFATRYILGPYPGPWVVPGQQIAYYNGVSAGLIEKPFNLRYNVGDIVTTLVFNGTIYDTAQSFTLNASTSTASRPGQSYTGSCSIPAGYVFDGQTASPATRVNAARFTVSVTPQVFSRIRMRALVASGPSDSENFGQLQGSWNGNGFQNFQISTGSSFSIGSAGQSINLDVQPSKTFECVETDPFGAVITTTIPLRVAGAQSIYVEAQNEDTSYRRARYVRLNQGASTNDFYADFAGELAFTPMRPGDNSTVEFFLNQSNAAGTRVFTSDAPNSVPRATTGTIQWYSPSNLGTPLGSGATYNGVTASVATSGNNASRKTNLTISVANNAITGREYYIRIPFTYNGFTHSLWYYVQVRAPLNNSQSINNFVYALGYTGFQITYVDSNSIRGRAVTGIVGPDQIRTGVIPRLLPWD